MPSRGIHKVFKTYSPSFRYHRMRLRYDPTSPRDHRLDLLRGFALFAMAVNHVGFHNSLYHSVTGRSVFLINAAEGFFFISGMTLGFIAARDKPGRSIERLLHRTWVVYLTTVGIATGFAALAVSTDLAVWGSDERFYGASVGEFLAEVLMLRTAFHGSDVLVTYVVYLGVAALALWLLHRGRGMFVAIAIVAIYTLSQLYPESTQIPVASFRSLASSSPVFFVGLLIGFYRRPLGDWWQRTTWPALRAAVDGVVVVSAIGLVWLYATSYSAWPWLGTQLEDTIGLREEAMPLLQLGIVFLYLRAFWMLADRLWIPLQRLTGWLLLPLGRASLFTYTAHLAAMVVIFNLPVTEDIGTFGATVVVSGYIAIIFGAVQARSAIRSWLARATGSTTEPGEPDSCCHRRCTSRGCVVDRFAVVGHRTGRGGAGGMARRSPRTCGVPRSRGDRIRADRRGLVRRGRNRLGGRALGAGV